ncbi:MAG: hypothetical protein NC117_00780 [Pseudoflavonifractor sp.]|nr:hypothetical protein [Pseudoflavonifractor sp.]
MVIEKLLKWLSFSIDRNPDARRASEINDRFEKANVDDANIMLIFLFIQLSAKFLLSIVIFCCAPRGGGAGRNAGGDA